jgi:hypothetical protein
MKRKIRSACLARQAPIAIGAPIYAHTALGTLKVVAHIDGHIHRQGVLRSVRIEYVEMWVHSMPMYFGTVEGPADDAEQLFADDVWISREELIGFRLIRRRRLILRSGSPNFPD